MTNNYNKKEKKMKKRHTKPCDFSLMYGLYDVIS